MSHRKTIQLQTSPAGVAAFAAADVSELIDKSVQVGGTFVGTLSVEGVLDPEKLDEYTALPNLTGITGATLVAVLEGVKKIRVNITAFTSGAPIVIVSGRAIR